MIKIKIICLLTIAVTLLLNNINLCL